MNWLVGDGSSVEALLLCLYTQGHVTDYCFKLFIFRWSYHNSRAMDAPPWAYYMYMFIRWNDWPLVGTVHDWREKIKHPSFSSGVGVRNVVKALRRVIREVSNRSSVPGAGLMACATLDPREKSIEPFLLRSEALYTVSAYWEGERP